MWPDSEIIERFLAREHEAVELVEGWITRAATPFRRRLGDDWEDVLQEVRIETLRLLERGSFRGEASLKTYLWRVTNHACLRRLRTQARATLVDVDDVDEASLPQTASALDGILQREATMIALRVLDELPDECRRMLQMVFGGASYQEMSQQLQIAEGTLRVRVLRCRKRAIELRARWLGKKDAAAL